MDNTLKGEEQESTEAELPVKRRAAIPASGVRTVCPAGISRNQLKQYLFRQHAGAKVDENVREHVMSAECAACQKRIIEIEAAEPFLRGKEDLPTARVEVIRKRSNGDHRREALVAEVSRKMAAALATPTVSFSLKDLMKMNANVRTVTDVEKRRTIAKDVVGACQVRWERLKSDNKPKVEAAAGRLMTSISTYKAEGGNKEATLKDLGLTSDEGPRDFLLYMMTNTWFLHAEGETTWDVADEAADGETPARGVVLFIDVLKQALQTHAAQETRRELGPVNV